MPNPPPCYRTLSAALTMVVPSSDPRPRADLSLDMGYIARFPLRRWVRADAAARPMRKVCFAVERTRPWSGSSPLRPAAWHGVHPSLSRSAKDSALRLRVSPSRLPPSLLRRSGCGGWMPKVVPSIRTGGVHPFAKRAQPPRCTSRLRWTWGPSLTFAHRPSSSGCAG